VNPSPCGLSRGWGLPRRVNVPVAATRHGPLLAGGFINLGGRSLHKRAECLRRLLVARKNVYSELDEPRSHGWIGQCLHDRRIEFADNVIWRSPGREKPDRACARKTMSFPGNVVTKNNAYGVYYIYIFKSMEQWPTFRISMPKSSIPGFTVS
jgi:hypothetical protein